jgi:hypothetical protein
VGRVQDLVDDVTNEGSFDATAAQVLRALTRRHRKMVVRARCYRKTVSLGSTVVSQRDYALPTDLRGIFEVTVAGITYGDARHVDISSQFQGLLWLCGTGGVAAPEEDASGLGELALIPTPGTAGDDISVRGFFAPPDLLTADDTTLKVPSDYDEELKAGGIAELLRGALGDFRADIAAPFDQVFQQGCEELRVDTNRKYRAPGPAQIRVVGYNA